MLAGKSDPSFLFSGEFPPLELLAVLTGLSDTQILEFMPTADTYTDLNATVRAICEHTAFNLLWQSRAQAFNPWAYERVKPALKDGFEFWWSLHAATELLWKHDQPPFPPAFYANYGDHDPKFVFAVLKRFDFDYTVRLDDAEMIRNFMWFDASTPGIFLTIAEPTSLTEVRLHDRHSVYTDDVKWMQRKFKHVAWLGFGPKETNIPDDKHGISKRFSVLKLL